VVHQAAGPPVAAAQPVVVPRAVEVLLAEVELQVAAERRAAVAQPVAAQPVVCPTLVAEPLAVVRAVIPLRAVAAAVAAAVE
jgi:hypothetical protein